jgi:hypothetical protein
MLHIHHLSFAPGTISQIMADVPSGLSLTPRQETEKRQLGISLHNIFRYSVNVSCELRTGYLNVICVNLGLHITLRVSYADLQLLTPKFSLM